MWDNFLLICLKLGKLQDAIQALHNLLELRDKYIDIEALNYLVELVIADTSHSQSLEGVKIHVQLAELMDKITSKVSVNPELWAIYAKYWIAFNDIEKAVDFRVKQCRSLQTVGWERDASLFKKTNSCITRTSHNKLQNTKQRSAILCQTLFKRST